MEKLGNVTLDKDTLLLIDEADYALIDLQLCLAAPYIIGFTATPLDCLGA